MPNSLARSLDLDGEGIDIVALGANVVYPALPGVLPCLRPVRALTHT
jgi:hypothetical protein